MSKDVHIHEIMKAVMNESIDKVINNGMIFKLHVMLKYTRLYVPFLSFFKDKLET